MLSISVCFADIGGNSGNLTTKSMDKPGIDGKPFKVVFDSRWFEKGDVIRFGAEMEGEVIKVHKLPLSWWKKLLIKIGLRRVPIFRWYLSEAYWTEIKPSIRVNNNRRNTSGT